MSIAVPVDLRLTQLTDDEKKIADGLLSKMHGYQTPNTRQGNYYEGKERVRDLGIAIPPHLRNLETVVGWPGTVVDVLEERLDHDGWLVPGRTDDFGISEIVERNRLNSEFSAGHLDALIYGLAFGVAGSASQEGDPDPLVTIESPTRMTATWNRRRRQVDEALLISTTDENTVNGATLWYRDQILELGRKDGSWSIESRQSNRLRKPPIVRLVNRPRSGDTAGRSEITRAIRAYTDNAIRTVLGMEVSREFFAAPMLWLLGADESSFVDKDGNTKSAWETYIGRMKALPFDEDGKTPDVKSFAGSSPAPFIEQLRGLAQLLAAEAGLPVSYLGLMTDNPPSADSVHALETRLIKRSERRQQSFGTEEGLLMRLALWIRDREDPGITPRPDWKDPRTPTRAAAADEATKLVGSGVLPADSEVTQKRVGLSEDDRRLLAEERRRENGRRLLQALIGDDNAPQE